MADPVDEENPWSPARSSDLYLVKGWGDPYFFVSEKGTVQVRPDPEKRPNQVIDLFELTQDLEARGLYP